MKKLFILLVIFLANISLSYAKIYYYQDLGALVKSPDSGLFCDVEYGNCTYDDSLDVELSFDEDSTYLDLGEDASIPYTISGEDADSVTLSIISEDEELMPSNHLVIDTDNNAITIAAENVNTSGEVRVVLEATNSEGEVVAQTYTYLDIATISSKNMLTLWTVEAGETIKFPMSDTWFEDSYDGHVDWGDDSGIETFENKRIQSLTHTYAEAGTYEIRIDGGFYKERNFYHMFCGVTLPSGMNINTWDVSHVINMRSMFSSAKLPEGFNISDWDVSRVTDMRSMFYMATVPSTFDISNWNTASLTNTPTMFLQVVLPETFDISNWNTASLTNISGMFIKATLPTIFDISSWNVSNITDIRNLFNNTSVEDLNLSGWNLINVISYTNIFGNISGNIIYNTKMDNDVYGAFLKILADPSSELQDSTTSQTILSGDNACDSTDTGCLLARKAIIAKGWVIDDATVETELTIDEDTALESRWTVSAGETVTFPVYYAYSGIIDWGDGTIEEFEDLSTHSHTYESAGTYTTLMNGSWGTSLDYMFREQTIPSNLDISSWNISNIKGLMMIFSKTTLPENFDINSWVIPKGISLYGAFYYAILPDDFNINSWDIENASDITAIFAGSTIPDSLDINNWDVSGFSSLASIFSRTVIPSTLDISSWDVSNSLDFISMFYRATIPDKFKLSSWNMSYLADVKDMFNGANILGDLVYDTTVSPETYSNFVRLLVKSRTEFPDSTTSQKIYVGANVCEEDNLACLAAETALTNKGWVITRTTAK